MSHKKILVVDDEKEVLDMLDKKLSTEGYIVILATRGKEAIAKTKLYLPDLILMDIVLPDIHGSEAVKLIKENPQTRKIPVIFLSGIVSKEENNLGKLTVTVDGRDYVAIPKPFYFNELLEEIDKKISDPSGSF